MSLEHYFEPYRNHTIGHHTSFDTPYGKQTLIYADWTASGRLYAPIEQKIQNSFGPFVGNTHSESNQTGTAMTMAYTIAREKIKQHVNADAKDVLICTGFGMTSAVNKLQRILGLKSMTQSWIQADIKPLVIVTHMEHHSNHTSWIETVADVVCLPSDDQGLVDCDALERILNENSHRRLKIGAFTACSNITGISTPYHQMARMMHQHGGLCFVDFAACAPYVAIDMHPQNPEEKLDGIYFSPHKFLGGPGASGVLIFDSQLYRNPIPDRPGGGTVKWTNPWGEHDYINDIEIREDGGTPGFLQTIRAALCIDLKNQMGISKMAERETALCKQLFAELETVPDLHILAADIRNRLPIISFFVAKLHFNLMTKLLNDRFGVQVRGGCSCAGTYGHFLLNIDQQTSSAITHKISAGDLSEKPGWVRISLHPMMTDEEVRYIGQAVREVVANHQRWAADYTYNSVSNEFVHGQETLTKRAVEKWFEVSLPPT